CTYLLLIHQTQSITQYIHFLFHATATTEFYTLSLHDALPISAPPAATARRTGRRRRDGSGPAGCPSRPGAGPGPRRARRPARRRSEEHTSELQSLAYLVCRLLLEKKKNTIQMKKTGEILTDGK